MTDKDCGNCWHYRLDPDDGTDECWGVPKDANPTDDEKLRRTEVFGRKRPVEECPWFDDLINHLEFVELKGEMTLPSGTSFTGFKPGQKLLHLTKCGGQPDMKIVTFENEKILGGGVGLVVTVKEHVGYIEDRELYTLESIQERFNDYTEEDARRWRAIHDGIIPAVQLSDEEIDERKGIMARRST